MKPLALGLLTATLLLSQATAVFAFGNSRTYAVQPGDTLWGIAGRQLGSPWCWPLIASVPENGLDYQGTLFAGDAITLPTPEDCVAIIRPLTVDATRVRETVLGYVPTQPWHAKNLVVADYLERTYRDVEPFQSYSKYDDMDINDRSLYRERDGDTWYVVLEGMRGRAWDYVDHVLRNDATGSVFYRARDVRGEWYVVKNEAATKLSFEPKTLSLNPSLDDVFAFTSTETETRLSSSVEEWTIPVKAVPVAADSAGRVLFREETPADVRTMDADGMSLDVCSSSVCSFAQTYWLGGEQIASATSQMIPLFSKKDALVPLPFFYEGAQKTFKYYGVFGRPWFDADDNLVFAVLTDSRLTEQVFEMR